MDNQTHVTPAIPTPEQLAAAQLILDQAIAAQGANNLAGSSDSLESAVSQTGGEAPTTIDAQQDTSTLSEKPTEADCISLLRDLAELYQSAILNPNFTENPKRIKRALDALKVPFSDDRAFLQYCNHARKDLIEIACKAAIEKGAVPVMPTEEEILAEAKRRQIEKQKELEEKERRKAEKKS